MPKVGSGNGVANIRIHRQSLEGVNSLNQIPNVKSIYIQHDNGFYKYQVNKIVIDPVDSDAFYLTIKQEHNTIPTGSVSSALVFTPYIAGKFKNSDFDSLLSNATEGQTSLMYQVVDNEGSQLQPTNLTAINNRTAGFAQVQDSNYAIKSYTRSRYDGTKHIANDFNSKSSTGLEPVEYDSAYFAYFSTAQLTTPELHNKTIVQLEHLTDLLGNEIPLDNSEISYKTVQQNFLDKSQIIITLDDPTSTGVNMRSFNGEKRVFRAGSRIEFILGTETTLGNFTSSVDFPSELNTTDYSFNSVSPNNQPLAFPITVEFDLSYDATGNFESASPDVYTFSAETDAQINFRFNSTLQNELTLAHDFTISIQNNGVDIASKTVQVPANSQQVFELNTGYRYFAANDDIRVRASSTAGVKGSIRAGAEFDLVQTPAPSLKINKTGIWTTGSISGNSLTSSAQLASIYGTRIQKPNIGSAFESASLPFTVEVGDEFRFDGKESEAYVVTDVTKSGKVFVNLDRDINSNVNIENFILRRYVGDSRSIILNTVKPTGATTGGVIRPKEMNDEADIVISKIVTDLKRTGTI